MADRILTLALKGVYFDQIKAGIKTQEYRKITAYWDKRLKGREYDYVVLTRGYPKKDDQSRRLKFPWHGYEKQIINHPHFGSVDTEVYAIRVGEI